MGILEELISLGTVIPGLLTTPLSSLGIGPTPQPPAPGPQSVEFPAWVPKDWQPVLGEAGEKAGINPLLLATLAKQESGFNPAATNTSSGAAGPFQFMPGTARMYGLKDIRDPQASANATARMIVDNLKRFGGDTKKALMAHFGGSSTKGWGPKTRAYGEQVTSRLPWDVIKNPWLGQGAAPFNEVPTQSLQGGPDKRIPLMMMLLGLGG